MKNINILIVLGLFVLLVGVAQPVAATPSDAWVGGRYDERPDILVKDKSIVRVVAHFNAATNQFEGLLNAYSANKGFDSLRPKGVFDDKSANSAAKADGKATLDHSGLEAQLSTVGGDLSGSLEEFNTALMEVYPTLSEEEQLAVEEAYSEIGVYLEELVVRTNAVFGKEILRIEFRDSGLGGLGTIVNGLTDKL